MLSPATLLTLSLFLQDPAAAAGESAPVPNVPYPILETVEPAEGDARALLRKVVDGMGREKLEALERIGFEVEYWNWRGPRLAYYEKFRTAADVGPKPIGFVSDATISPDTGKSQGVRYVVNDDDRFYVQRTTVSSSAVAELAATHNYFNQLFLVLGPWLLERAGTEAFYDGVATISTFEPKSYSEAEDDGSGGYSDYRAVTIRCHKIRVAIPDEFLGANGAEADLWITDDDEPRLLAFRSSVESRTFAYGPNRPTYHIVEWQDVGGMRLPHKIDASVRADAERRERIVVANVVAGVEITPEQLRRP